MFLVFALFVIFDALFFFVFNSFLMKTIRDVQKKPLQVKILGAFVCYTALSFLMMSTLSLNLTKTFLLGASIYAVYEGTNYAIFKEWPLQMMILDTLWGGLLFVLVKVSYKSLRKFL